MFLRYLSLFFLIFSVSFSAQGIVKRDKLTRAERVENRKKLQKASELALKYFKENPKELKHHVTRKQFEVFARAVKKKQVGRFLERLENPEIKVPDVRGNKKAYVFNHPISGLVEMGYSMLRGSKRENVFNTYKTLYDSLPKKLTKMLESPKSLQRANMRYLKRAQSKMDSVIAKYRDVILELRSLDPPRFVVDPFKEDVKEETGHMSSNSIVGDQASQCPTSNSNYHPKGLISQVPLAQMQKLTSIKDQGGRGTCAAFAIAATAETEKILNGYSASNFSEQSIYAWAKLWTGGESEKDGLPTANAVEELKEESFKFGYETLWQYNRSSNQEDFNGSVYPSSCDNYSEFCSNQSMQMEKAGDLWLGHIADQGPYINNITSLRGWDIFRYQEMNRLIALNRPAVVSMSVDEIFVGSMGNSSGYLDWDATGDVDKDAGHSMMYVGYVRNDDLPDGVRDARGGGYVVFKNSYGTGRADCGFFYADHDYVKERMRDILVIDI